MDPAFFELGWQGLGWSAWVSLDAPASVFRAIPKRPGLYRIRVTGTPILAYIGQTGRSLRDRLYDLRVSLYRSDIEMPWNDPHTAAQNLWALRVADNLAFECSVVPVDLDLQSRLAFEDLLLWQYRLEQGQSTLCNFGRFHRHYVRSSNRREGVRGYRLPDGQENPAAGPSYPPLKPLLVPEDSTWMGLTWQLAGSLQSLRIETIPKTAGIYKILDFSTGRLLYIGESGFLRSRLRSHARAPWVPFQPIAWFHELGLSVPSYQRHELESDLLGAYFSTYGAPPAFQYVRREAVLKGPG